MTFCWLYSTFLRFSASSPNANCRYQSHISINCNVWRTSVLHQWLREKKNNLLDADCTLMRPRGVITWQRGSAWQRVKGHKASESEAPTWPSVNQTSVEVISTCAKHDRNRKRGGKPSTHTLNLTSACFLFYFYFIIFWFLRHAPRSSGVLHVYNDSKTQSDARKRHLEITLLLHYAVESTE